MSEFSNFDFAGSKITFKYNGKDSLKSIPGAFFSFLFYLFIAYYFIYEAYTYYLIPYKTDYQLETINEPRINFIDYPNFLLMNCKVNPLDNAISNMPEVNNIMDEELVLQMVTRVPYYNRQNVTVQLKQCTIDMFPIFPNKIMNDRVFENYYKFCTCAPYESLKNLNVSFFFSDTYYTYLEYVVKIKPSIFNDPVKRQDAYNLLAKNPPRNEFFFVDTNAELSNYEFPFTHFINVHLNYINPDYTAYSDLWFKRIQMRTDDNYFVFQGKNII